MSESYLTYQHSWFIRGDHLLSLESHNSFYISCIQGQILLVARLDMHRLRNSLSIPEKNANNYSDAINLDWKQRNIQAIISDCFCGEAIYN